MRTPVIAGNWKMNTTPAEGRDLATAIATGAKAHPEVEVIVCPPFTGLASVVEAASGGNIKIGAQNVHPSESGAFTGEISTGMLKGLVSHVVLGHSERRALFAETDSDIASKAIAVNAAGMTPIVCVGESLEVRKSGAAEPTLRAQLRSSLDEYAAFENLIVAYEPVWAIGTGEAATPQQAQLTIGALREELRSLAGAEAENIRILYGGSVNGQNIGPFMDRTDIDGALVGGASLKADEFLRIIEMTARIAAS